MSDVFKAVSFPAKIHNKQAVLKRKKELKKFHIIELFIWGIVISIMPFSILLPQDNGIQFENISLNKGLSSTTIYKIIQDRYGFMWFGTQNGLNKFDGYSVTVYKNIPFDTLSLADNWIQALIEARDGNIWIGTHSGGVFMFDRNKEIFINYKNIPNNQGSLINNRVWDLTEDKEGNIWIGTSEGLDKLSIKTKKMSHYLSNKAVNSVIQGKDGFLWAGTWGSGLFQLDSSGKIIKQFLFDKHSRTGYASNKIKTVYEDREGIIWLGTNEQGLIRLDRSTGDAVYYFNYPFDKHSISYDRNTQRRRK